MRQLQREPVVMGVTGLWKLMDVEKGKEFDAWSAECLKLKVRSGKGSLRTKLLCTTWVKFRAAPGAQTGDDAGGVTVEFFSNLFADLFLPQKTALAGSDSSAVAAAASSTAEVDVYPLFQLGDSSQGKLLPHLPTFANTERGRESEKHHHLRLRLAGCALLKAFFANVAVGAQLARFLFDYIVEEHRPYHIQDAQDGNGAFSSAAEARQALINFSGPDRVRALQMLLASSPYDGTPLDVEAAVQPLVDFGFLPPSAAQENITLKSAADADELLLRCARFTLLDSRRAALSSFRDGFQGRLFPEIDCLDLTVHLSLFQPSEAAQLICGKSEITKQDLLQMINWYSADEAEGQWAGTSKPQEVLKEWIDQRLDDRALCFRVFHAITSRRAIPDPRQMQVKIDFGALKLETGEVAGEQHFCKSQTCFNWLSLPRYETVEQVERGMNHPEYGLLKTAEMNGFSMQ